MSIKRVTTRTRGKGLNSKNRLLNVWKNTSERKLLCADIKRHTHNNLQLFFELS